MSSMSYCRFTNTRADLNDCLDTIQRDERLSEMEVQAGRNMFTEFLTFCRDCDIIDDYDGQLVRDLFQNLKDRESRTYE